MSVESPANVARPGLVPEGRLEPNAIGGAQDTVIGMATAAPIRSFGVFIGESVRTNISVCGKVETYSPPGTIS